MKIIKIPRIFLVTEFFKTTPKPVRFKRLQTILFSPPFFSFSKHTPKTLNWLILINNSWTDLHVAQMAGGGIHQHSNFELLEPYPKDPVTWRPAEWTEAIPACHWSADVIGRHLRTWHIFVDVHCFITVVSFHLGWK